MAITTNGSLIQAAYGGYLLNTPYTSVREELVYAEPGFTTNSPIEFALDKADQFYFVIRKRADDYGITFEDIVSSNFVVSVKDATLGLPITATLENFGSGDLSESDLTFDSKWQDGLTVDKKVVLIVDSGTPPTTPSHRIRIIDCEIRDRVDDSTLFFRVLVDDYSKVFSFLEVRSDSIGERNTYSTEGSTTYRSVDGKGDFYILISPFASFYEVDKGEQSFDYPLNTIFYKRSDSYNKEDFAYQITGFSHSALRDSVRVKNVPGYPQMGVIIVDKEAYNAMSGIRTTIYVDVEARGLISEMRDTFRMTLVRI